jgi:hypothetical protein
MKFTNSYPHCQVSSKSLKLTHGSGISGQVSLSINQMDNRERLCVQRVLLEIV